MPPDPHHLTPAQGADSLHDSLAPTGSRSWRQRWRTWRKPNAIMAKMLALAIGAFPGIAAAQTPPVAVPNPVHLVIDSQDNLFVAVNYGILKITPAGKIVELRKEGVYADAQRFDKRGMDRRWTNLVIDSKDNLYASDGHELYRIRVSEDNRVSGGLYIGTSGSYQIVDGPAGSANFNDIGRMAVDRDDNIYVADSYDKIAQLIDSNYVTDDYLKKAPKDRNRLDYRILRKVDTNGNVTTLKTAAGKYLVPNSLSGMAADGRGGIVFAAEGFNRSIQRIDLTTGAFTVAAGQPYSRQWCPVYTQGEAAKAEFVGPETIILDRQGDIVFADSRLHRLIRVAGGRVSTLAGNSIIDPCAQNIGGRAQEGNRDGKALTALFNFPKGLAYDSKGNLFIADMNNSSIRKLAPDGMVTTFAK